MTRKKLWIAGIFLSVLLPGCGPSETNAFVRFQIEGQTYEVVDPVFRALPIKDKLHLMELTQVPMKAVPGTTVQWQMTLDSVETLAGQNLDLNSITPEKAPPLSIFQMTKDLTAHSQEQSVLHLKIDRIEDGYVEGSFTGKAFMFVSMTKEMTHEVDVTARFRARLEP